MLPPNNPVKTSLTIDSTWTKPQLEAAYNWLFVTNDGSKGIHNTAYAVGLAQGLHRQPASQWQVTENSDECEASRRPPRGVTLIGPLGS